MTKIQDLWTEFMDDPEFRREYARIDEEFRLLKALARARVAAGLTQEEVARRIGTEPSEVARLESGTISPRLEIVVCYADAVGVRLDVAVGQRPGRDGEVDPEPRMAGRDQVEAAAPRDERSPWG